MIKKEMIDAFGMTRKTLDIWEKGEKVKRQLLYEVLKSLPIEYVTNVKELLKLQNDNLKKLKLSCKS